MDTLLAPTASKFKQVLFIVIIQVHFENEDNL